MAFHTHDAIVFACEFEETARDMRDRAVALGLQCTSIEVSKMEGYSSFLVIPDGWKDGREGSDICDRARDELLKDAKGHWVHVQFSKDTCTAKVVRSSIK